MKKFTLVFMALLAISFSLKAQQYVSTEPANRNVILEEFTGRGCGYCTDGHRIANQIMANNPGRVWAINVHAGGYALTSYPNFNTTASTTILGGFSVSGFPSGVVNRTTSSAIDRGQWTSQTNNQLGQAAECNVAGMVQINPDTRVATITVEVYYTGNSSVDENYLTVAMLQDSILGSQADYGNYNPTQWLNGQYVHMHVLRDVVTSVWGDAISPTTQGTLITKTYEYQIPQSIGNPNGVEVVLDHIFFLAWVAERYQGTPTRPILTACELESSIGSNEPIYPIVNGLNVQEGHSCTQEKVVEVKVSNIGTETLTSLVINATMEGETQTINWEGTLPQFGNTTVLVPVTVPFGSHTLNVTITEANGVATQATSSCQVDCLEWVDLDVEAETEQLKLMLVQDKWGAQTTWEFTGSNGEVIASGGPYSTLAGSNTTLPHAEIVTVPANECVTFTIHDTGGNGICCTDGNGYYKIFDSQNHVVVDGDGAFGSEATHLISVKNVNAVQLITEEPQILDYYEVVFNGSVTGECQGVGFEYQMVVDNMPQSVPAELNGNTFTATVRNLALNTEYLVRAYALVGNVKMYGEAVTFRTWVEGVSELGQTLKIYPNPADEMLYVEGSMTLVEVYNTMGQCLLSQPVNGNTSIGLSDFSNGIYFLRVSNNGESVVRKFSVNR